jgi:homopolymeric O-antigen transport system permease protein
MSYLLGFVDFVFSPLLILWHHRRLIGLLVKREIEAKYKGSLLGLLWMIAMPIAMLCIYTVVFGVIFESHWPDQTKEGITVTALYIYSGLILFTIFSENIGRAPGLVLENTSYVKKLVFPLEILPWVSIISSLVPAAVSFLVFFALYLATFGIPPWTALLLPVLVVPLVLIVVGLSWLLAALGVFFRDLRHAMGLVVMVVMFSAPLFFSLNAVPENMRPYLSINPMVIPLEASKNFLFRGSTAIPGNFWLYLAIAWAMAALGRYAFARLRWGFADVV